MRLAELLQLLSSTRLLVLFFPLFFFFLVHGNIRQADVRYHGNCHRAWDEEEVVVLVGVR